MVTSVSHHKIWCGELEMSPWNTDLSWTPCWAQKICRRGQWRRVRASLSPSMPLKGEEMNTLHTCWSFNFLSAILCIKVASRSCPVAVFAQFSVAYVDDIIVIVHWHFSVIGGKACIITVVLYEYWMSARLIHLFFYSLRWWCYFHCSLL